MRLPGFTYLVIISRTKKDAQHALSLIQTVTQRLELTLHPEKTRLIRKWDGEEGFDFLGMHHRNVGMETSKGKKYYRLYQFPSRKAMKKMKATVKQVLANRSSLQLDVEILIDRLNPKIRGWKNYYGVRTAEPWLSKIDWYILERFVIWYNKKHACRNHWAKKQKVTMLLKNKGLNKLVMITNAEGEECRKAG